MIGSTSVGIPKNADGSLAFYTPKEQDEYLRELAESLEKVVQLRKARQNPGLEK